jgi:hypothetical protein
MRVLGFLALSLMSVLYVSNMETVRAAPNGLTNTSWTFLFRKVFRNRANNDEKHKNNQV